MKFPRMIAVLGLTCALLLSGCGSEETSSLSELMASKKNGTQQSPLTKMPEHMKDMYGMGETSDSALSVTRILKNCRLGCFTKEKCISTACSIRKDGCIAFLMMT